MTDPLAYLVGELSAVGTGEVPQAALLFEELREIHAVLSRHNRLSSPAGRREVRTCASRRMAALSTTERPVTVDLRVDCTVVLPQAVAREAETAAAVLTRLTPYPCGSPAWLDYHHTQFLERYGDRRRRPRLRDPER